MYRLRRRAARCPEASQRQYPDACSAVAGAGPSHRPSPHPKCTASTVAAGGRVITKRRACISVRAGDASSYFFCWSSKIYCSRPGVCKSCSWSHVCHVTVWTTCSRVTAFNLYFN